jgi:Homeodomain-like domain
MKLVPKKRRRAAGTESTPDAELESASLALRQGLEETQAALAAERELRVDLEEALEEERKRRAKLERRLRRAERAERTERTKQTARTERTRRPAPGGKPNGAEPNRDKSETWAAARKLAAEGFSHREIARRLAINRRTVARLVGADAPPRYRRAPSGSMLDPLEPVMLSVLRDRPGIDAPAMTELLRTHGYGGSVDLVRRRLRRLRAAS